MEISARSAQTASERDELVDQARSWVPIGSRTTSMTPWTAADPPRLWLFERAGRAVGVGARARFGEEERIDIALDPAILDEQGTPAELLRLTAELERVDGAPLCWWAERDDERIATVAEAAGLRRTRALHQMRVPLPLPAETTLDVRPFRPGDDDEAWVEVNNRAFHWHPEQAGWTVADLRKRLAEEWVDLAGFLVHETDGRFDGFCWTKVHPAAGEDPAMGEIHIIAVDPDAHGRGLGRGLTVAGLDHLSRGGLRWGMLYVEADNDPAVGLYRSLGFEVHHTSVWYRA